MFVHLPSHQEGGREEKGGRKEGRREEEKKEGGGEEGRRRGGRKEGTVMQGHMEQVAPASPVLPIVTAHRVGHLCVLALRGTTELLETLQR